MSKDSLKLLVEAVAAAFVRPQHYDSRKKVAEVDSLPGVTQTAILALKEDVAKAYSMPNPYGNVLMAELMDDELNECTIFYEEQMEVYEESFRAAVLTHNPATVMPLLDMVRPLAPLLTVQMCLSSVKVSYLSHKDLESSSTTILEKLVSQQQAKDTTPPKCSSKSTSKSRRKSLDPLKFPELKSLAALSAPLACSLQSYCKLLNTQCPLSSVLSHTAAYNGCPFPYKLPSTSGIGWRLPEKPATTEAKSNHSDTDMYNDEKEIEAVLFGKFSGSQHERRTSKEDHEDEEFSGFPLFKRRTSQQPQNSSITS